MTSSVEVIVRCLQFCGRSPKMENKIEKLILHFDDIKVLKFGDFKLKSGIQSPIYVDLRVIISYPKVMDLLTDLIVEKIKDSCTERYDHICGVPYTALPIAALVSSKMGIPMLIRRKEAKEHGTRKIIEGVFTAGDNCIVIEDIVSSGSSITETVEDLKKEGLKVDSAIVVLDREQGGVKNLENKGIKVHILTSLSQVLSTLLKLDKVSQKTVTDVKNYIAENLLTAVGGNSHCKYGGTQNRRTMPFSERVKLTKNETAAKIFHIMEAKKTLLCLAADVTKTSDLLRLATQTGPYICIFKTHFDGLEDFSKEAFQELRRIAKNFNFLIMEDRKFSDIGHTVCLQYNQVKSWADLVTAHSISGEAVITALKSCNEGSSGRGCFLVAELSCEKNLIKKEYTQATLKLAENHTDFVVGLVCQTSSLIQNPALIQLTPGVKIEQESDNLGQHYNDPEFVVLEKGADVAVVGRGIISSSNPEKAAILYKEKLWNAYQKRISGTGL